MTSVTPPLVCTGTHGGEPDWALQLVTVHFGHRNPGPLDPITSAKADDGERMFLCELDGIWYPESRAVIDGEGRKIPEKYFTERTEWPY